jgi:DcmR-like sensory protein
MAAVAPSTKNAVPCDHLIQAYTDDAFLSRVVTEYVGSGPSRREAAVIIASPAHVRLFTDGLITRGVDVPAAVAAGQLLFLDAARTLARFMVEGRPDRTAFLNVIAAALRHVRSAGHGVVRLYGEMVDLLWQDRLDATLQLEALWNEILVDERVSLLCAYRIDALDRHAQGVLRQITHCHSRLMPADDPERLEEAVDRAYTEVFGVTGDVAALRDLMVSRCAQGATVPAAHAALFALDDMPPLIANDVRARARWHYRRGSHGGSSLQS